MHSLLKYSLLWPSLHGEETEAYTACGRQTPLILPVKAKTRVITPNNMEGIISLVEVFFYYYYFILYLGRWKFEDFFSSFLLTNRAQQRLQRTLTAPSMAACMAPLLVLEPPFCRSGQRDASEQLLGGTSFLQQDPWCAHPSCGGVCSPASERAPVTQHGLSFCTQIWCWVYSRLSRSRLTA